jgi:hypothetical protein
LPPGGGNCVTTPPVVGAGSSSLITQLSSSTATAIHNAAHATVTAVGVGTTVHDFVTVTGQPGSPTPSGNVTIDWFLNGGCTGAPAATSLPFALNAAGQVDASSFSFTVNAVGQRAFLAHYAGDATYTASDGVCEPLNVVDANIQITPATANNAVGTNHVLTITVNALGGNIDAGPHTATASITSGPGSFVGPNTCTYTGGGPTASCTVTITSATPGTTTVSATSDIPVGGVTLTRTTNGTGGSSGPASKTWVDANIQISPQTAANPLGANHVLTITVNALGGNIDAGPHTATASIVSGPGSFVGSPTCTYTGGGTTASCTVTITSATPGTTVVSATSNIPVNGIAITRTTGTAANTASGGSGNASKNWVDANIQITPGSATNPVGTNHVLTCHVNVNPGTGFVNAPDGTTCTVSITSGPGTPATQNCTTSGGTGSCTATITSATAGTTTVSASTTVSVGGVTLTRTTNGAAGNSAPATKLWADDTVTTAVRDASNADITNTTVQSGTVVHDEATVAKAAGTPAAVPSPSGTVSFTLFNSGDCTGTVVATDPNKPLGAGGLATSATFTTPSGGGFFSYRAHYNGDANYPAHDAPCEPFQVNSGQGQGRVTGGGSIFWTVDGVPNTRITHGEELRCDPNDKRQSLEINWPGGNNFHLEKLINSVVCFNDPLVAPPPPPGTVFDTYAGNTLFQGHTGYHGFGYAVGTGICNKLPATIYFIFSDAGEPGTGDVAEYHITGGCTLDVGPALIDRGNVQFHKN